MRLKGVFRAGAGLLFPIFVFCGGRASAQTAPGASPVEMIKVMHPRPVAAALDVIAERYGVPIDYVDPPYAGPHDTEVIRSVRGTPVRKPFLAPTTRTIAFQYEELNGRPEGGITSLIRQVLDQFAAAGGPILAVRKLITPDGPRWEVYADQPDVLDATIDIPKKDRTLADMLVEICRQLSANWGHKFGVASAPGNIFFRYHGELGADHVTARKALLDLMGRTLVLRLYYDPDDGQYAVNIVNRRYPDPPRPLPPPPPKPLAVWHTPPFFWLDFARIPQGRLKIQSALASAGYLQTSPTDHWDANATDAIRRFQAANGLPATGTLDAQTVLKLESFLPVVRPRPPPPSPIWPDLFNWLQTTKEGQREIQTALAKAGFYTATVDGNIFSEQTQEALEEFQRSNDLPQTGRFDYKTAEKLAPFLPSPSK